MDELVIRPGVERVDSEEGLVEQGGAVGAVRELGPGEPSFLVVFVECQEFIERLQGFFASVVGTDAGPHSAVLASLAVMRSCSRLFARGMSKRA